MQNKLTQPWKSKTLWVNLVGAVAALFIPGGSEFISKNPELVATAWALINMGVRVFTKKPLTLNP